VAKSYREDYRRNHGECSVKKLCLLIILPLVMMIAAVSCSSTKGQKTDSVAPEAPPNPPPPEPAPEIPEEVVEVDIIEEIEEVVVEDTVEEPVLAEEEPPVEVIEPEPPVVAVVPEPPPPPPPPPPVTPAPKPEPPKVTTPPPVAAKPVPPPPPVEEEKPPVEEPPPPPPPPRDIPELPNPTPGISGRQDAPSPVVFSRVVRATVGQLVEVPFRGTGWVYLGEAGAQRGIIYDSRRLEPDGQNFIFRTERAGEYALKFYRQDFIRDFIINDYVQVIVGAPSETAGSGWFNPPVDRSRVIAEPRWPSALAEAQALRADSRPAQPDAPAAAVNPAAGSTTNTPSTAAPVLPPAETPATPTVQPQPAGPPASPQVTTPSTPSVTPSATPPVTTPAGPTAAPPTTPPPSAVTDASQNAAPELPVYIDPAEYLEKAKEEFAAGRVASAISFLDRFCENFPSGTDETWWLYGQFYEANSPSRNILAALNCYRRLVQEYPQSSRFEDARKRIAYLQRYYININ
jgi:hypothetical protein